mmetsp:Transcript_11489/g.32149  ORF Transcript_11489/g.32149 Transcript_11489/m.32149 type:complete len:313 (-) Transcript_11489:1112-2050(-)
MLKTVRSRLRVGIKYRNVRTERALEVRGDVLAGRAVLPTGDGTGRPRLDASPVWRHNRLGQVGHRINLLHHRLHQRIHAFLGCQLDHVCRSSFPLRCGITGNVVHHDRLRTPHPKLAHHPAVGSWAVQDGSLTRPIPRAALEAQSGWRRILRIRPAHHKLDRHGGRQCLLNRLLPWFEAADLRQIKRQHREQRIPRPDRGAVGELEGQQVGRLRSTGCGVITLHGSVHIDAGNLRLRIGSGRFPVDLNRNKLLPVHWGDRDRAIDVQQALQKALSSNLEHEQVSSEVGIHNLIRKPRDCRIRSCLSCKVVIS